MQPSLRAAGTFCATMLQPASFCRCCTWQLAAGVPACCWALPVPLTPCPAAWPAGKDGGIDVNKLMELADVALEEEEEERELQ